MAWPVSIELCQAAWHKDVLNHNLTLQCHYVQCWTWICFTQPHSNSHKFQRVRLQTAVNKNLSNFRNIPWFLNWVWTSFFYSTMPKWAENWLGQWVISNNHPPGPASRVALWGPVKPTGAQWSPVGLGRALVCHSPWVGSPEPPSTPPTPLQQRDRPGPASWQPSCGRFSWQHSCGRVAGSILEDGSAGSILPALRGCCTTGMRMLLALQCIPLASRLKYKSPKLIKYFRRLEGKLRIAYFFCRFVMAPNPLGPCCEQDASTHCPMSQRSLPLQKLQKFSTRATQLTE